jgi:hypothetical protein
VTIDAAGRYHASFVVEVPGVPLLPVEREVGIDLGLTHFAVLSDGTKVDAPRIARKAAAKLQRAQKEYARRQKGSANREKSRRKVARAHVRVGDTRRDWLHKLSTTIVQENQLVAVEDLAVSGLARTRPQRARRGLVDVRSDAGVQGASRGPGVRPGGPLVPLDPGVLGVRGHRRSEAVARAHLDLRVRDHARPGRQRGPEHPRGGTRRDACGDDVRPRLAGAVVREAGTSRERGLTGCTDRSPRRSRRGGRQLAWTVAARSSRSPVPSRASSRGATSPPASTSSPPSAR